MSVRALHRLIDGSANNPRPKCPASNYETTLYNPVHPNLNANRFFCVRFVLFFSLCLSVSHRLHARSYERFLEHFARHAFYGVMVCMHFTPWKVCPSADGERIGELFERDMYGTEFFDLSMAIGGDAADERIAGIVEHASDRGYMRIFDDEAADES